MNANQLYKSLMGMTKQNLTARYGRVCLGRISNPKGAALSKSQMAYDIVRAEMGRAAAATL